MGAKKGTDMKTVIHVMRHGEVDNPEGILYGRLPGYGLTELGQQMAQTVADHFVHTNADITHVIVSPLLRAQQTATPTALAYGIELEHDHHLIEAESVFEGVAVNANPWVLAQPQYWRYYLNPLRPSWGESYEQAAHRMTQAVARALREARGHEALLVSHQMPIVSLQRLIRRQRLGHSPLSRQCSLASLTSLIFNDDVLVGMTYTEPAAHLLSQASDMVPGVSEAQLKR